MLPDLVYVYDLDAQRMRLVNRQVSTMLGYTPEVVQGTSGPPFGEFLHPDDVAAQKARVQEFSTAAQDEFLTSEYRVRHVDGAYRWLQSRETVFTRTPEGRPQEILGYAVDITEQKRLSTMLQQQTLDPKEMGRRLKMFREGLNMTQAEFGRYLGEFDQERISTYERGVATIPIALILAIRAKGHPFEAVLGTGPAAVLHHTAQYLRRTHQDRVLTRELLRLTLELVQKDCARIEQALQGSQQEPEELSQTHKKLLQQLANLEEH
jgi:PAS domain S-box-containing protein